MNTEKYLVDKYGLIMGLVEIAEVLRMSVKGLRNAISANRLPIHTYRHAGRRVADARDIAAYLDNNREAK